MSVHAPTPDSESPPDELIPETVYVTREDSHALSCSLVLSSTGINHHLTRDGETILLNVAQGDSREARRQILAYEDENRNWPPKPETSADDFQPLMEPPTLLLVGALALFFTVTGPWAGHSVWFKAGAGDAEAILRNGEWYRLITALTLHADTVHLLGNCLFGGFLYHFFCKLTGNGLGLFTMLVTATLANLINVTLHGGAHLFVGFSTAVFAIIGMLAMISRTHRSSTRHLHLLPYMAGASLLAMIGSSGERTDLGAHFFGLCCGLPVGWLLTRPYLLQLRRSFAFQTLLFLFACATIIFAWQCALA
ncbi:MAG: rhomboid family intramembrane serine protease [Thermodesulfobacteriota bacterium]